MIRHSTSTACFELDAATSAATPDIDICTDEPTLAEMARAVKKLKNDRAAGSEDIPPEFLKCALPHVPQALHSLFQCVWPSERVPAERKDGITVSERRNSLLGLRDDDDDDDDAMKKIGTSLLCRSSRLTGRYIRRHFIANLLAILTTKPA